MELNPKFIFLIFQVMIILFLWSNFWVFDLMKSYLLDKINKNRKTKKTLMLLSLKMGSLSLCHYYCWCSVSKSCLTFAIAWTVACQAPLSSSVSWSLLKFMFIESVMLSNNLILCHYFPLLPSIFSSIRVFSSKLALCTRWPNYWSSGFSISPSNEYWGLISFRIDLFDLLPVQKTLENLL